VAAGHRLKISSVRKEENTKTQSFDTCLKYLLSVTELSDLDITHFGLSNWLYFNLGSVSTCWNNVKVLYLLAFLTNLMFPCSGWKCVGGSWSLVMWAVSYSDPTEGTRICVLFRSLGLMHNVLLV